MIAYFLERTGDLMYLTYNPKNTNMLKHLFISSFINYPNFRILKR